MSNNSYAIMEQQPSIKGLANTPLVNVVRGAIPGPNPVGIEEHDDVGHLVLRGDATLLANAVTRVLDLAFPDQPLSSCSRDKTCIRWISPDEWLVTVPSTETSSVESSLRDAIVGHVAIVNVSPPPIPTVAEVGDVLGVEDLLEGDGDVVEPGDTVSVHYLGTLTDGTIFDASWNRGRPFTTQIGVGMVIQGWDQGIVGMREGGRRLLKIPSDLAYGETGSGSSIGPDTPLIFVVDLLRIQG